MAENSAPFSAIPKKRKMSAAARRRIGAAQNWLAKQKAKTADVKASKPGRKKISKAARARMAAAAKERWAKAKAAGRTTL